MASGHFHPFVKIAQNDLWPFSSHFFKSLRIASRQFPTIFENSSMICGHFSPVLENCSESQVDNFPPFLKIAHNYHWTFFSCFWKLLRTAIDIFLPFLKIAHNDHWIFSSFFWNLLIMTNGYFPHVFENLSEWLVTFFYLFENCLEWPMDIFLLFL